MDTSESRPDESLAQPDRMVSSKPERAPWGQRGLALFTISSLIAIGGVWAAIVYIPHAINSSKAAEVIEDAEVKVVLQRQARNSLVLGMTAIVCTLIALLSFIFPFVGRHDIAVVLLGSCFASSALIIFIFKPF